ncbi:MAG: BatA domain-containing protein [Bacteroidales bacterium]|jgi:hypothetical protein|nr:BatA domain-containing protein [Bacteroidales bacterium]
MNLNFTYPQVLFGLFLILIPIIIHLFTFRKYQHIFFHSIFLLKETQKEDTKTRRNLKEILILLSRIFAIIFLVFAFAQPYIPVSETRAISNNSPISLYIDNSFSSQNETQEGNVLEVAKSKAYHIIEAYPPSQQFYIVSNTPDPRNNIALNKARAIEKITEIETTPFSEPLSNIYARTQIRSSSEAHTLYLLSDFQTYSSDIENITGDSLIHVSYIPIIPQKTNNISIDSVWFASPYRIKNQTETLHIRIRNTGTDSYTQHPIELYIFDTLRSVSSFTIEPESTQEIVLEYSIPQTGSISGKVSINDYPILYDNTYFFSYTVKTTNTVVSIYDNTPTPHISNLFSYDSQIQQSFMKSSEINYADLSQYDAIILDGLYEIPSGLTQHIAKHIQSGKTAIVIPPELCNIASYNEYLSAFTFQRFEDKDTSQTQIQNIDFSHSIFANLFEKNNTENIRYPQISSYYRTQPALRNGIISLHNQHAVLQNISNSDGACYLFTIPFSTRNKDFLTHPIFMSLYNMIQLIKNNNTIQTSIGEPLITNKPTRQSDKPIHLVNTEKNIDFIPQIRQFSKLNTIALYTFNSITESGIYSLSLADSIFKDVAMNYARDESNMNFLSAETISERAGEQGLQNFSIYSETSTHITQSIKKQTSGIQLWRYALILSLVFICIEIMLIRLWHRLSRNRMTT